MLTARHLRNNVRVDLTAGANIYMLPIDFHRVYGVDGKWHSVVCAPVLSRALEARLLGVGVLYRLYHRAKGDIG